MTGDKDCYVGEIVIKRAREIYGTTVGRLNVGSSRKVEINLRVG